MTIKEIQEETHTDMCANGFWDLPRNKGELIALMHSELSECLEGLRKDLDDDHLPGFKMEVAELADTIIRICDYAEGYNLPLTEAIRAKITYNKSRPRLHGKKF